MRENGLEVTSVFAFKPVTDWFPSSTVIEYVQEHYVPCPDNALAYYYFDFNDPSKQKVSHLLSSIIAQLLSQNKGLPQRCRQLFEKANEGRQIPLLKDLKDTLGCLLKEFNDVFIVVDALDECPEKNEEREELLSTVEELHSWSRRELHLLVTSRRLPDIEAVLDPILTTPAISIQNEQIDVDIQLHIKCELAAISKKRKWSDDLKTEVEDALVKGANGM